MDPKSQRPKYRDATLASLNAAIKLVNLAEEASTIKPATAVFASVSVTLATIRDTMINKTGYVELGLACADVCKALDRGLNGKRSDELSESVSKAIEQFAATVAEIQEKIAKRGGQGLLSRFGHAKNDKEAIASWRSDLNAIINILNTELAVNTRANGSGVRRDVVDTREVVPTIRDNAMSTQPIIRDVQNGIINTRAPVSDAYRNMARSQEGTRSHRYSDSDSSASSNDSNSAVMAGLLAFC